MARQNNDAIVKVILGAVIGVLALILFGTGIFFIFRAKNKIAKLEKEKKEQAEIQNMANVQTPPQQLQPDGTVVTDPQQQAALQQQQGQAVQQQAANPAPQRTVSKTNTNKSSKNTNQTNQTVPTRERTLITKSSDLDLVNVRKDPNSKSAIVNELDDNEKVRVTGKNRDWYRVQDSKGNKGYIHKSQLQRNQSKPAKQDDDDSGE